MGTDMRDHVLFNRNQAKDMVLHLSAGTPGSVVEGQIWYDPTDDTINFYDGVATAAKLQRVLALNLLTIPAGDMNFNNVKLTNVADPASAQDGATKNYVDNVALGISSSKTAARTRVTSGTIGTWSGSSWTGTGATFDGIVHSAGDLVLADAVGSQERNGLFVYSAAAGGTLTRAESMNTWEEIPGQIVVVEQGTHADKAYLATSDTGGTLNTTAITFIPFGLVNTYTAGNGLTLTSFDFSVNVDNSSIEISGDTLRVKALGITNAMLAGAIDLATKTTGTLAISRGGTGATTAVAALAALGGVGKYEALSPALTADTFSANITHNLGEDYPHVTVWEVSSKLKVDVTVKSIDSNNIQIRAANAYAANALAIRVAA